jgi:branched-chain amino acid transport system permease protein
VAPNEYILSLGVMFLINLVLVASLNLVLGYAGQISLCHGAFFGLGAYVSGVLSVRYGITPAFGMAAAIAGTTVAALLIALPTLRLRGHYLAMGTLGFNAILTVLFNELVPLTGGPNGLAGIAPFGLFGYELDTPRGLRAISGSEIAAGALGIDTFRFKVAAFSLSAGFAGLAGAMYAHFNMYASPETFSFFTSVLLVVMVALGGWGSYWGPVFGALIYTAMPELLRKFQDAELFLFGLCMIVVLLYLPGGIAGLRARRRAAAPAAPRASAAKEASDGAA